MRQLILAALAVVTVAPAVWSQNRVYVTAPSVRMISADTMQLSALARNGNGDPIANASFQWTSSNTAVAKVDSSGMLTAALPGLVDITANYAGTNGILRVQVLPQRIDISPANSTLEFGGQQQFTAVAYDVKGQPIPNVTFVWHLGLYSGADSTTVRMQNGLVTATTLGYFIVRAAIAYPGSTDQFQQEFDGQTPFRIVPPQAYKLSRLVSDDYARPQFSLRGRRTSMAAGEDGTLYLSGILDGLANGLLQYSGGQFSPLMTAGGPSFYPGVVRWDFDDPSVDSSGNVVARMTNIGSGNMIVEAAPDGTFNMLVADGVATDRGQLISGIFSNRYSLSDTGDVFFRANANEPNLPNYTPGMFRYSGGGLIQEAAVSDPLPGFTGAITGFDNSFGIDSNGAMAFVARGPVAVVLYRKETGGDPMRLIGSGDKINGAIIAGVNQLGVARNGDLYVYCGTTGPTPNQLVVFPKGQLPAKAYSVPSYISTLMDANSTSGIIFTGDAGSGYGLYTWNPLQGGSPKLVILRGRALPTGEPYYDAYWATLDAAGRVYAAVQGVDSPWLLVSLKPVPAILAAAGDTINVSASVNFSPNLVLGDKSGPFHIFAGGNQPSIFEVGKQSIKPLAVVNDKLPSGGLYTGTNPVRKSPSGVVYLSTDQLLYRLEAGGVKTLAGFPLQQQDGIYVYSPYVVAVNDQKQVAFASGTNAGHQRLSILNPGGDTHVIAYLNPNQQYVTPLPGGGTLSGVSELAINESGAVMANASVNGAQGGLFLWDGTAWQTICRLQSCTLDGQIVTSISQTKAVGNRFCALFNTKSNLQSVRCFENGTWTASIVRGDISSDGTEVNSIGAFDINRKGDVVAVIFTQGLGGPSLFLKNEDGYTTVNAALFPLSDGTTFRTIYSVDLRDDGRIFFVGMDLNDKMVVYEADPNS